MGYLFLAVIAALGLGVGLGLLVARLGDAIESIDPDRPPTMFRVAARWWRPLRCLVRGLVGKGVVGASRAHT